MIKLVYTKLTKFVISKRCLYVFIIYLLCSTAPLPVDSGHEERRMYRNFWDQFSGKADNTAMMLNANADQIEALDRADILALLPPVAGLQVADIGAGIGRFTTAFAEAGAARVVSTDFVAQFVAKNRQRNARFANQVQWRVGDALGLQFELQSLDLVFTNWLLMYLADEEAVQFVTNALRWLRPGGHLHLRESCSEPSTKKSAGSDDKNSSSLHSSDQPNPTRYRFSSAYINLLRTVRCLDADTGRAWRFDVLWACSVGVYIERQLNWRQVRWFVKKVPADDGPPNGVLPPPQAPVGELAKLFGEQWPAEQRQWDQRLEQPKPEWMESLMDKGLQGIELPSDNADDATVFGFSARKAFLEFGIDAQALAKHFGCRVWAVETNPFAYRHALTQANRNANRRVRIAWNAGLEGAMDFWATKFEDEKSPEGQGHFDAIVGTEILAQLLEEKESEEKLLDKMARMLNNGGQLASLEVVAPGKQAHEQFVTIVDLLRPHFRVDPPSLVHKLESGHRILAVRARLRRANANGSSTVDGLAEKFGARMKLMGGF